MKIHIGKYISPTSAFIPQETSSAQGSLSVRRASWRMPARWAWRWRSGSSRASSRPWGPCATPSSASPSPSPGATTPTSRTFSEGWQGERTPKGQRSSFLSLSVDLFQHTLKPPSSPVHLNRLNQVVLYSVPLESFFFPFMVFLFDLHFNSNPLCQEIARPSEIMTKVNCRAEFVI